MKHTLSIILLITATFISNTALAVLPDCIVKQYGNQPILENAIVLDTPDIAENGAVVSVGIKMTTNLHDEYAVREVSFFNEFRKEPVAHFLLGKNTRSTGLKTRMRLRDSSHIYAVARLDNGDLISGESYIKVTIEGCGGGGMPQGGRNAERVCQKK